MLTGHTVTAAGAVITASGVRPTSALGDELAEAVTDLRAIGDCVRPATVGEVVHTGFFAGAALEGRARQPRGDRWRG